MQEEFKAPNHSRGIST